MNFQEYTLAVPHMKDVIAMGPEFARRNELKDDVYYPIVHADTGDDFMDYDSIKTLPVKKVRVMDYPGDPVKEKDLYIESHFAYLLEE